MAFVDIFRALWYYFKNEGGTFMDVILLWFEGLSRNLLITALSAIIPLGLGVLFTFFASRNRIAETVFLG